MAQLDSRHYPPAFSLAFLHPRYWGDWLLFALLTLLCVLPRAWRCGIADLIGSVNYTYNAKRKRYATTNVALCFPGLSVTERNDLVRKHFQAAALSLFDLPMLLFAPARRLASFVNIDGAEHLGAAAQAEGKTILLTCHSCAIDVGGVAMSQSIPIIGFYKPFKNSFAEWLVYKWRTRFDLIMATRDQGLRPIVKAVRAGRFLYYPPDEDLGVERTIFASFFGQQKASIPVLGKLVRLCEAKVLPCYTWYDRSKHRYQVKVLPPLENFPQGDELTDTQTMNSVIEKLVTLHPEQYLWTYRMFKTRPDGEGYPYKR